MLIDLMGQRFGRLTVISQTRLSSRHIAWRCICQCGNATVVSTNNLRTGHIVSCGCRAAEARRENGFASASHGHRKQGRVSPEYTAWRGMHARCWNSNDKEYWNYGGRGITVCERWGEFAAFLADMGSRPSARYSVERKDTNGHYEPDNCKWATAKEQARNKRNNFNVTYDGRTQCLAAWAEELGINRGTLRSRLVSGLTPADAFFKQKEEA